MNDSRDGLEDLAALNTVARLIYHNGRAGTVLPGGWARTLLETGMLTDNMGRTLDLGIGAWTARYSTGTTTTTTSTSI